MRTKWKNVFLRILWFELLSLGFTKLLFRGLYKRSKIRMNKKLTTWVIKVAVVFLLLLLLHCVLLLGLGALALYLNTLLDSSYQGFLVVSGGGAALLLLFWLLSRVR